MGGGGGVRKAPNRPLIIRVPGSTMQPALDAAECLQPKYLNWKFLFSGVIGKKCGVESFPGIQPTLEIS